MAGHNKWSQIKHKKAKTDAQKGKAFSKVSREITMAAKLGGPDPNMNARLRLALQKAREVNMPKDNIDRAISKGAGSDDDNNFEDALFEAYAAGGVGILIEALTDNKNRTVPNIKAILGKQGGSFAAQGAVSYQFDRKGLILFEPGVPEDDVMEVATESGADDIELKDDGSIEVLTDMDSFEGVKNALDEANLSYLSASIEYIPQNIVELDLEKTQGVLGLMEKLEDDDDVQNVYSNISISDDIAEQLDS
jgi:YebC/PmpR family DNA-binding regulatory protein